MLAAGKARTAPLRPVRLGVPQPEVERRADGCLYIRSRTPLPPCDRHLLEPLAQWAEQTPDRVFLAQRDDKDQWRTLTYAQVRDMVGRIAAALLRRGLSPERPVAILSGNDIEHALLGLAAMSIGVPYAPVSVPYSLMSSDFGKLKSIVEILTPGLVFAADGKAFARAIAATVPPDV